MGNAFPQIIQNQFLQCFGDEISHAYHFGFIAGTFGFNDNAHADFSIIAVVNH